MVVLHSCCCYCWRTHWCNEEHIAGSGALWKVVLGKVFVAHCWHYWSPCPMTTDRDHTRSRSYSRVTLTGCRRARTCPVALMIFPFVRPRLVKARPTWKASCSRCMRSAGIALPKTWRHCVMRLCGVKWFIACQLLRAAACAQPTAKSISSTMNQRRAGSW